MFSKYFLRILKICLPFKPYRIYEFKSEWKPFSKIGTIHYCKDWIRSSIQTIRISTGHHFTVFTVVIGFSILRSKITPKNPRDSKNQDVRRTDQNEIFTFLLNFDTGMKGIGSIGSSIFSGISLKIWELHKSSLDSSIFKISDNFSVKI